MLAAIEEVADLPLPLFIEGFPNHVEDILIFFTYARFLAGQLLGLFLGSNVRISLMIWIDAILSHNIKNLSSEFFRSLLFRTDELSISEHLGLDESHQALDEPVHFNQLSVLRFVAVHFLLYGEALI